MTGQRSAQCRVLHVVMLAVMWPVGGVGDWTEVCTVQSVACGDAGSDVAGRWGGWV